MIEQHIPEAPKPPAPVTFFNSSRGQSALNYYEMTRNLPDATKIKIEEMGAQNPDRVAQVVMQITVANVDWTSADIQNLMKDDNTINYLLYALNHDDQFNITIEDVMTYDMFYCAFKSFKDYTVKQCSINEIDIAALLTNSYIDADTIKQEEWFNQLQRDLQDSPSHLQQCLVFTSRVLGDVDFGFFTNHKLPCKALGLYKDRNMPFRAYRSNDKRMVMVVPNMTILNKLMTHQFGNNAVAFVPGMGDPGERGIMLQSVYHAHVLAQYHPDAPFPKKADDVKASLLGFKFHDLDHIYCRSYFTANQRTALIRLNQLINDNFDVKKIIASSSKIPKMVKSVLITLLTKFSFDGDLNTMRHLESYMIQIHLNTADFDLSKAKFLVYVKDLLGLLFSFAEIVPNTDTQPIILLLLKDMQSQEWQDEFGFNITPADWEILLSQSMQKYSSFNDQKMVAYERQQNSFFDLPPPDGNRDTKIVLDKIAECYKLVPVAKFQ